MDVNQIKKALYKEKPIAGRAKDEVSINTILNVLYFAVSSLGKHLFIIPKTDAENFKEKEPAQLLIRWLDDGKEEYPYASWWIDKTGEKPVFYTKEDYLQRFN